MNLIAIAYFIVAVAVGTVAISNVLTLSADIAVADRQLHELLTKAD